MLTLQRHGEQLGVVFPFQPHDGSRAFMSRASRQAVGTTASTTAESHQLAPGAIWLGTENEIVRILPLRGLACEPEPVRPSHLEEITDFRLVGKDGSASSDPRGREGTRGAAAPRTQAPRPGCRFRCGRRCGGPCRRPAPATCTAACRRRCLWRRSRPPPRVRRT
jgi:hypothetical protein